MGTFRVTLLPFIKDLDELNFPSSERPLQHCLHSALRGYPVTVQAQKEKVTIDVEMPEIFTSSMLEKVQTSVRLAVLARWGDRKVVIGYELPEGEWVHDENEDAQKPTARTTPDGHAAG